MLTGPVYTSVILNYKHHEALTSVWLFSVFQGYCNNSQDWMTCLKFIVVFFRVSRRMLDY